jgi:hypothetical protein
MQLLRQVACVEMCVAEVISRQSGGPATLDTRGPAPLDTPRG